MIGLVSLIAALAVEGRSSRGRAQELGGRLGLSRQPQRVTGTLARLMWVEKQYGWAVRQGVELFLIYSGAVGELRRTIAGQTFDYNEGFCLLADDGECYFWLQGNLKGEPAWVTLGYGNPAVWLARPQPGRTTDRDALIPLVARWMAHLINPTLSYATISLVSLTNRALYLGHESERRSEPVRVRRRSGAGVELREERPIRRQAVLPPYQDPGISTRPLHVLRFFADSLAYALQDFGVYDFLTVHSPRNLMSMMPSDLIWASDEWHENFVDVQGFGTPARAGVVMAHWPDGGRIERLVTARQLEQEGKSLGHCVGGYWPAVRDGRTAIFSYRNAAGIPQATIEVSLVRWSVVQFKGPHNAEVPRGDVRRRVLYYIGDVLGVDTHDMDEDHGGAIIGPEGLPIGIVPDAIQAALRMEGFEAGVIPDDAPKRELLLTLQENTDRLVEAMDRLEALHTEYIHLTNLDGAQRQAYIAMMAEDGHPESTPEEYAELIADEMIPGETDVISAAYSDQIEILVELLNDTLVARDASYAYPFRDITVYHVTDNYNEATGAMLSIWWPDSDRPVFRVHADTETIENFRPSNPGINGKTPAHALVQSSAIWLDSDYSALRLAEMEESPADTVTVVFSDDIGLSEDNVAVIRAAKDAGANVDADMLRLMRGGRG